MGTEPEGTWPDETIRRSLRAGAVALFVLLSGLQAGKPLQLDNTDFPAAASAIAETGRPFYYRGDEMPQHPALYHPPLYLYALAGWFRVFGTGPEQARWFGVACTLGLCFLVVALLRKVAGAAFAARCEWALWILFLLQPFTLQSTAILDIDTSIYGPALVALLALAAGAGLAAGPGAGNRLTRREYLAFIGLLTLTLWMKWTTVLLVIAAIPVLLWPRFRIWRSLRETGIVVVAATTLFLATYSLYGLLVDADIRFTFRFLVASFLRSGGTPHYLSNLRFMAPFMLLWMGALPLLAAPLGLSRFFARELGIDGRHRRQLQVLLVVAGAGSLYYLAQTLTFGHAPYKYVFPFWPLLLVPLGALTAKAARLIAQGLRSGGSRLLVASCLLATVAATFLCGRYLLLDRHLFAGGSTRPALALLCLPAGLALVGAVIWWKGRGDRLRLAGSLLWSLAVAAHFGFQVGVAVYQAQSDHSTTYNYGQRGSRETVCYVQAHTGPDDVITSMKDIGEMSERRYIESYMAIVGDQAAIERMIAAWESGRVKLIVFTEGIGEDQLANPVLKEWLADHAVLAASFGNYRIYRPLPPRSLTAPSAAQDR